MTLNEEGISLNIPDSLRWEKFDEEDFYRDISQLGLKAVDFVFYGKEKIILLEIKNYTPNLEENISDADLRERKRQEIAKRLSPEKISVQLANKLVSSIYLILGKKLKELKKIIFCALLIFPPNLDYYPSFITTLLNNLATGEENLLKVEILVLNEIELAEKIISAVNAE